MGKWLVWLCSPQHQVLPPEEKTCTWCVGGPTSLHAETVEQHPDKSKCWELWPLLPISCSFPALLRFACTPKLHPWSPDMVMSHTYQVPLALIFWTVYLHLRPFPCTFFLFVLAVLGFCCSAQALSSWDVLVWSPHSMWDLSSSTRDQTQIPCIGMRILNHWTTSEVLISLYS